MAKHRDSDTSRHGSEDSADIAVLTGNAELARDVEESIRTGLEASFVRFSGGNNVAGIFQRSLDAAVRDIAEHPQGILFRRLIEFGLGESGAAKNGTILTATECEKCVGFIKSHMINRFKGELAELLAIAPCVQILARARQEGKAPPESVLYWGEAVQERAQRKRLDGGAPGWTSFQKGADGLLVASADSGGTESLTVIGVVEVKSMRRFSRGLRQIEGHLSRLGAGVKLCELVWTAGQVGIAPDRSQILRVFVVPHSWKLSREWEWISMEDAPDQLVTRAASLQASTTIEEEQPNSWRVTLAWSHEAIEQAAYEMTFWYMSNVGRYVYERKGLPKSWSEMTLTEAGYNAIKEVLYHLIYQQLSPRHQAIATQLYNVYGFGYALGVDSKQMLWSEDFAPRRQ